MIKINRLGLASAKMLLCFICISFWNLIDHKNVILLDGLFSFQYGRKIDTLDAASFISGIKYSVNLSKRPEHVEYCFFALIMVSFGIGELQFSKNLNDACCTPGVNPVIYGFTI